MARKSYLSFLTLNTVALLFLGVVGAAPLSVSTQSNTYWIANEGQWEGDFSFKCEVGSAIYYVTPKGMTVDYREFTRHERPRDPSDPLDMMDRGHERDSVSVRGHVVQIHYVDGNETEKTEGEGMLSHYSNYFLGRDSCTWRSRVGHYQTVLVEDVWRGIDVEYRADRQGVETVYHVKPGADVGQIQMEYLGLDAPLRTDSQGNLILETSLGEIKEKSPVAFQQNRRTQESIGVRFQITDENRVGYLLDSYDTSKEVVIDPLLYGTFWGGRDPDVTWDVALSTEANVVTCGKTVSDNFPTTPGAYQETFDAGAGQGFISMFSPLGDSLIFSTFVASTGGETTLWEIEATPSGIWCGGVTASTNFPTTPDAMQSEFGGDVDVLLVKISDDGASLEYGSYLGGAFGDILWELETAEGGKLLLGGLTASLDFPTTPDALFPDPDAIQGDAIFCVFDPVSRSLDYSTYIAGNGDEGISDILDRGGGDILMCLSYTYSTNLPVTPNAAITELQGEYDGYILLWNYLSNTIHYATYLGGSLRDYTAFLAIESDSRIIAAGGTGSNDFPVTTGAFDTVLSGEGWAVTVTIVDTATGIVGSTLLEGSDYGDYVDGLFLGSSGISLVGEAGSFDFPVTPNADDTLFNDNGEPSWFGGDIFVARLSHDLSSLQYSTFLGGVGIEQWINASFTDENHVWIVGNTGSDDFPTTENAVQPIHRGLGDGFVVHFELPDTMDVGSDLPISLPDRTDISVAPNPFNSTTHLTWTLPMRSHVVVNVYDLLGRSIVHEDFGQMTNGVQEYVINGMGWTSGIYFATVSTSEIILTSKLLLIR